MRAGLRPPTRTRVVQSAAADTGAGAWAGGQTGRAVGMKSAGGIRTAKEAISYLVVLYETLGPQWMTPDRFRFGASSLLNDILMQIRKERTGRYSGGDYFTLD